MPTLEWSDGTDGCDFIRIHGRRVALV